jgi:hypothetical protein
MNSSRFIGRVGGLAIALGVGAAAFGGASSAWADSPSDGSSATGSSATGSSATGGSARSDSVAARTAGNPGPARAARHAGPKASKAPSAAPTNTPDFPATATTSAPVLDRTQAAPTTTPTSSPAAAADVAPEAPLAGLVEQTPAPERATVAAGAKIATVKSTDDPTGGTPASPAGALVDLALLEYARRQSAPAAATFAPGAAATTFAPPAAAASLVEAPEVAAQAEAAGNVLLIMTPSGVAIPSAEYLPHVQDLYFDGRTDGQFLFTPEGLYPISGVKSLPLNTSVDQGNDILLSAIKQQIDLGNTVTVFGYSQSSIISSQILGQLAENDIPAGSVTFTMVGNEMNPNGGFLSRFPDFNMPSLGIPFYGPTPVESEYVIKNYTLEYDGFADFPRYPLNVLSVLNAGLGIVFVHGNYTNTNVLTPEDIANAIELPSSLENQKFYILPTENLPLLEPLRLIPIIGDPIADLLQPALRVIVNLGYGDPNYGWSTNGNANEVTTFGIFPDVDWGETINLFVQGIQQGVQDFIADILPGGSMWQEVDTVVGSLQSAIRSAASSTPHDFIVAAQTALTNAISAVGNAVTTVADFISNAAASLYAMLLPTADIANAIVTVLPAYGLNWFLDGVEQMLSGDLINGAINAVFMPLAAATGLLTTAGLIEVLVIAQGVLGAFGITVTA